MLHVDDLQISHSGASAAHRSRAHGANTSTATNSGAAALHLLTRSSPDCTVSQVQTGSPPCPQQNHPQRPLPRGHGLQIFKHGTRTYRCSNDHPCCCVLTHLRFRRKLCDASAQLGELPSGCRLAALLLLLSRVLLPVEGFGLLQLLTTKFRA